MEVQNPSCHLKTVFLVTTYGVKLASRHRWKNRCASSTTLSYGFE
jgi:hypothetical protein